MITDIIIPNITDLYYYIYIISTQIDLFKNSVLYAWNLCEHYSFIIDDVVVIVMAATLLGFKLFVFPKNSGDDDDDKNKDKKDKDDKNKDDKNNNTNNDSQNVDYNNYSDNSEYQNSAPKDKTIWTKAGFLIFISFVFIGLYIYEGYL